MVLPYIIDVAYEPFLVR